MSTLRALLLTALLPAAAAAQAADGFSVSEDDLFSTPDLPLLAAASEPAAEEKKTVGLSGDLVTVIQDVVSSTGAPGRLDTYAVANFALDARLQRGYKAYANMETTHYSSTGETDFLLREAFVDFNLARRAWFRAGKQVLQWGRCALWNPTDLVNVEKTPFIRKIGAREGASGLKLHVPYGTRYNLYAFLDTGTAADDRDAAAAAKFEFLAGRTEMAFSAWNRRGAYPVLGYDISSRLGGLDIKGEVSASRRDNAYYIREDAGALSLYRKDREWPVRAALNLARGFRVGDFNDRLTVAAELFYNPNGYASSPFRDRSAYAFTGPLALVSATGTRGAYLLGNGLYEPNQLGRRYAALFTTFTRFIAADLALTGNYIRNLDDRSGAVTAGLTYADINDFSAGFLATLFTGPARSEYTYAGVRGLVQLTASVSF
ncbi:MAG: hypothetical protein AB1734_10460 [Elusimicrobiota bacterium]